MDIQDRRRIIIEYLTNNPGCNKQKVVKAFEPRLSRVPVLNTIEELKQDGMVRQETEKENSREHKLYVNTENILISVSKELEEFEQNFFSLLEKVIKKMRHSLSKSSSRTHRNKNARLTIESKLYYLSEGERLRIQPVADSLWQLRNLFFEIVNVYMIRSIDVWSQRIQDQEIRKKIYFIVFNKIANMNMRVSELLSYPLLKNIYPLGLDGVVQHKIYATKNLVSWIDAFNKSNMEKESRPLLNSIWKIYDECKEKAFPEVEAFKWDYNFGNDSLKKFVELCRKHPEHRCYPFP
jgi:hypothetical protein